MKYSLKTLVPVFVVILVLSFTSFYSIAYILAALASAVTIKQLFIFKTIIQRFVLSFLTLLATIPLVGLVCWLFHSEVLPIYNIVSFFLIIILFNIHSDKPYTRLPYIDKVDIVATLVALAPVVVILASYATAPNLSASLFQLASEGWDNGSHILMLENNSSRNGYPYGPSGNGFTKGPNAYPQAWHLATADVVNGFGGDRFVPSKPMSTILAYMITSVTWMMIACYLFVLCAWRFYEHNINKKLDRMKEIVPLTTISLLIAMVVFTSSLMHGFTNYLGTLAYLMLLSALVIEAQRNTDRHVYVLSTLFGTMSVLMWFLTLPAVGLTILLMILTRFNNVKESIVKSLKDWRLALFVVLCGIAMVFQLYIFQTFSTIGASGQLTVGARVYPFDMQGGGPLQISPILFSLVIGVSIIYLLLNKIKTQTKQTLLILVAPWLLLVFAVFFYQNIATGYNSYYLSKVMALSLTAAMLPISGLLIAQLMKTKISYPNVMIPILSVLAVGVVIIGTGQPVYGLSKLFQVNARTTYSVAATVTPLLSEVTGGKSYIVVLTNHVNYEDVSEDDHGKLEIRVVNTERNCTYGITKYTPLKQKIKRLSACADTLAKEGKTIIVVTSDSIANKVKALQKSNIIIKTAS